MSETIVQRNTGRNCIDHMLAFWSLSIIKFSYTHEIIRPSFNRVFQYIVVQLKILNLILVYYSGRNKITDNGNIWDIGQC